MAIEFSFDDLPTSTNSLYRAYNGRVILSKKYREFKNTMKSMIESLNIEPIEGDIALELDFYISDNRTHDLDNMLKSLIDTLQPSCFKDDNQIISIHCRKHSNCDKTYTSVRIAYSESP